MTDQDLTSKTPHHSSNLRKADYLCGITGAVSCRLCRHSKRIGYPGALQFVGCNDKFESIQSFLPSRSISHL